jgi:A1 cistron-splicing factor AAR2
MPRIRPTPTLLLPHLPARTLVGIDLLTFTSTEQFYGIGDLPEGWHFLYTGTTASFSLRCGAWFYIGDVSKVEDDRAAANGGDAGGHSVVQARRGLRGGDDGAQPEIRIWKWDQRSESLEPLKGDTDEDRLDAMRWKANLGGLRQMGALFSYKSRHSPSGRQTRDDDGGDDQNEDEENDEESGRNEWIGLTDRISPQLFSRILGDPEIDYDGRSSWTVTSASTAPRDADRIPGLSTEETTQGDGIAGDREQGLCFLPVDLKRTWREGAIGRERTEGAQDRSWALGDLIQRYSGPSADSTRGERQILGELQFTFLMVLTLMNYSCLEQWKRLLDLIFTCRTAIGEREAFFRDVLRLLLLQLRHCDDVEGGLFEMDGDYGGAFLRRLLTRFRNSMEELLQGTGHSEIASEMDALEKWVQAEFGWELRKEAIMRRGMLQLEDGEQVEMEMNGADEDDETGEYAPLIVDTGEGDGTADEDLADVNTPVYI